MFESSSSAERAGDIDGAVGIAQSGVLNLAFIRQEQILGVISELIPLSEEMPTVEA